MKKLRNLVVPVLLVGLVLSVALVPAMPFNPRAAEGATATPPGSPNPGVNMTATVTDPLQGERHLLLRVRFQYLVYEPFWYMGVDPDGGFMTLYEKDDPRTYFEVVHLGGNVVALRSSYNGKYCGVAWETWTDSFPLRPNRNTIDESCHLTMEYESGYGANAVTFTSAVTGEAGGAEVKPVDLGDWPDWYDYASIVCVQGWGARGVWRMIVERDVTLGEPSHLVVVDDIKPIVIMGEPPKHIDYIRDSRGNFGEINVSRNSQLYSLFKDDQKMEISSSNTHTSDKNFGVEVSAEAKADFGIPVIAGGSVEVTSSAGYSYNKHQDEINKDYHSIETRQELKASTDDYLVCNISRYHIWRYPILEEGKKYDVKTVDGDEGQLYFQIVVPEPDKANPYYFNGKEFELYQPVHENGNILSYPWSQDQIREFEGTDTLHVLTQSGNLDCGGNSTTLYVNWTGATETGKEVKTSNTVDVDASIGVSAKVLGAELKTTVKTYYDQTWADLTTSNTNLTQSKGITIAQEVSFEGSYAYKSFPLIYTKGVDKVKQDGTEIDVPTGTLKLGFSVDLQLLGTKEWWQNVSGYGDDPDLALNLPYRWVSKDGGITWQFNEGAYDFKKMKGLFVEDSDGKTISYVVEEGEKVSVKARIYNYSLVDAQNVKVKFEAQESTDNKHWGDRFQVGTATIPVIGGFQNSQGTPNWEYAKVAFDTSKAGYYRLWVSVDPDNEIKEIEGHDLGEKYSNNEGYFGIPLAVTDKDEEMHGGELHVGASGGETNLISFSVENAREGDVVMVSLWVAAEGGNASQVMVSFYDGNPDDGGNLFDTEFTPFIGDGSYYYVEVPYHTWGKVGENQIYAVVHEQMGEIDVTNNIAVRTIKVLATGGLAWYTILAIVVGSLVVIGGGVFAFRRIRRAS